MSVNSHFNGIVKAVSHYEALLKNVSEEDFVRRPSDEEWSYSETISHIFQSNIASLIAVEKCILGTGVFSDKKSSWKVWLILLLGTLPPGKYKAPESMASMVKLLSKEEACN